MQQEQTQTYLMPVLSDGFPSGSIPCIADVCRGGSIANGTKAAEKYDAMSLQHLLCTRSSLDWRAAFDCRWLRGVELRRCAPSCCSLPRRKRSVSIETPNPAALQYQVHSREHCPLMTVN